MQGATLLWVEGRSRLTLARGSVKIFDRCRFTLQR